MKDKPPPIQQCVRPDHPNKNHGHYGYGGRFSCTDFSSPLLDEANMGAVWGRWILIFNKHPPKT